MFSVSEIKTMLQITSTEYDSKIQSYIPVITDNIISHCNNHFLNPHFDYFLSSNIVFDDSKIQLTNIGNYELVAGDYIRVYGSLRNDNTFLIGSVSTDYLTIDSTFNSIENEDLNKSVLISLCKYPQALKLTFSQMVGYKLENYKAGIVSKQIDDYSYTLEKDLVSGYPKSIMSDLNNFKHPYLLDYNSVYGISRWY